MSTGNPPANPVPIQAKVADNSDLVCALYVDRKALRSLRDTLIHAIEAILAAAIVWLIFDKLLGLGVVVPI